MSNPLTDDERAVLAGLADAIAPRWRDMPSASEIDLAGAPLDRVLKARPDLAEPLSQLVSQAAGRPADSVLQQLQADDQKLLQSLLMIVAGAYYMHPKVHDALGYSGQQALSLPRDGFGAEELAVEMMQQPPRYRLVK